MQVISINVALPRDVRHEGHDVKTGIFKTPVAGPVRVERTNLEGDGQADLMNHGGESKAVYAYSLDHYVYWQRELGLPVLPYGQFGENLTVAGLDETLSCIGDHLAIGGAVFAITQPRVPCFKLGIRFGNPSMPKLFTKSARTGFYLKVLREGTIAVGDAVEVVQAHPARVAVKAVFQAYFAPTDDAARRLLQQALEIAELSPAWREQITRRLAQ